MALYGVYSNEYKILGSLGYMVTHQRHPRDILQLPS